MKPYEVLISDKAHEDMEGIDRKTADRKILKLSGGEQQRVGIARKRSWRATR